MKWRLMRKRARGQQNIGDYYQCVLESKVAIFIHVLESCMGDIYWWDIGWYLLVRYWRVAEEYCVFLVLPICRTDGVSPSKVPKTKQNTSVEDASLPAPRTAWHLKCRLYWICVACNGGAIFFYFHLLAFSWVHQGQCYLPGTEACWAQGPPKAMAFKCVKFSSDCYWRVFGGRQLSILFAKHQVWKQHCSWLHEIPRGCSKDCSGSLLNIYLWSLAPDGKKIQLRLLVAGLGNPSMRRPGASGRPRSAPRKTHGSQRVGPNKKLMIGMQRKEKKTNRKKTGPRRGRLKRWSAAKWPWETLLSNGQLWHWRHEDSTLSTKPVSCLAWCNMGMLVVFFFLCCLQCSVSTLGLLRYCAALEFSSMNWSLQVRRGRKSWVSGGWWSMVKGSQSWLETDWRLTSGEKYWRELLLEVYVVLEGPNIGETYLRTVGQFGNMLFDLLVSLKFSLISRKGSFICFSESLQLEYFSDWWP